jgi:hypothetical protein
MKAILTILYHEKLTGDPDHIGYVADSVEVTVRKWIIDAPSSPIRDIVLESRVRVDGEMTHHQRYTYNGTEPDAFYQRVGIETFDMLVNTHPHLNETKETL